MKKPKKNKVGGRLEIRVIDIAGIGRSVVLDSGDDLTVTNTMKMTNDANHELSLDYGRTEYHWNGVVLEVHFFPNMELRKDVFHKLLDGVL